MGKTGYAIAGLIMGLLGWAPLSAQAQVNCTQLTQPQLLQSFSDVIGAGAITPLSLRNFVCSTITSNPGGGSTGLALPLPTWTTATRPVNPVVGAFGFNVTLNTTDLWNGTVWLNPGSWNGGTVTNPVSFTAVGPAAFQVGPGTATFTGPVVMTGAGTGLAVTNNLTVGGVLTFGSTPSLPVGPPGAVTITPKMYADGVTPDDANFQAALAPCVAVGGLIILPPGKILLNGSAGSFQLHNCVIRGTSWNGNLGLTPGGTTLEFTSTSVKPFIIGSSWGMENLSIWYPNQTTGTTVYPPLFSDDGTDIGAYFFLDHVNITNAYDVFSQTVGGPGWGNFFLSNVDLWADHDAFQLDQIGDSVHFVNVHFTPGSFPSTFPYTTVINAAFAAGNTIFHVRTGSGVNIFSENMTTFAWRNLIKIDSGGGWAGALEGNYDGIGTLVDNSAGGIYYPTAILQGGSVCGVSVPYPASGPYPGNYPCFLMGNNANTALYLDQFNARAQGDFVDTAGSGPINITGSPSTAIGFVNDGGDYYIVNVTAGTPDIIYQNNRATGETTSVHSHGLYSASGLSPFRYLITGNNFIYFNDEINLPSAYNTIVTDNITANTAGANSVIWQSTVHPINWANNSLDKPATPAISSTTVYGAVEIRQGGGVGYTYYNNGSLGPPTFGTRSAGTRTIIYPFESSSNVDYAIGISSANPWFSLPSYGGSGLSPGNGWNFYSGTMPAVTLDSSGSIFSVGKIRGAQDIESGQAKIWETATGVTSLDVPGESVTGVAVNAGGTGYQTGDVVTDGYGSVFQVTATSGVVTGLASVSGGGVAGSPPCTTGCALAGGNGTGATANLTWSPATSLGLANTTMAGVILGNATGGVTVPGTMKLATSTTGAGTQTFTNSPCSGLTTERWVPIQITGQTGTWYVAACQ